MKFLVVDDDPTILSLLTEILIGFGYENVVKARSGDQALQILKAHRIPFDCLMLDIQMPEMTGIELCRQVRRHPDYANTPIIMVTAMRDEPYVSQAFAAGATDYTTKPFDVFELMERIRLAEITKAPAEARKLAMARAAKDEDLIHTDTLLSRAALENFTRTGRRNRNMSPAAIVVHVSRGCGYGVGQVAKAISDILPRTQVFSAYLGQGDFLAVCDQSQAMHESTLHTQLSGTLAGTRKMIETKAEAAVHVGCWSYPRAYERSGDLTFMDRAIARKQSRWPTVNQGQTQSLMGRLFRKR